MEVEAASIASRATGAWATPAVANASLSYLEDVHMFFPNIEVTFALEKSAGTWKAAFQFSLS